MDKLNRDIHRILAGKRSLYHREFAMALNEELSQIYFWRDFFTLAYNPILGGDIHYVGVMGGYIIFRQYGRNTVVASHEKGYNPKCTTSYNSFMKSARLGCGNKDSGQWYRNFMKWDFEKYTSAMTFIEYGKHHVWYYCANCEYHHTCNQNVMFWPACHA